MSLIEEALRKQREETERGHPATAPSPAPARETPPPLPTGLQPEAPAGTAAATTDVPPEKSRRTWRMLVGIAVLIVVVVAVLIWMVVFGIRLFRTTPPPAPAVTAGAVRPVSVATTQAVADIPPTVTTTAVVAVVTTPPAATLPDQPAAATTTVAAIVTVLPSAVTTGTVAAVPVEMLKPPLVWPQITVSGIMGGGRAGLSMALVNGQMMSVGEMVESAKIMKIDRHGVTFTYSGETRTVAVGGSTE